MLDDKLLEEALKKFNDDQMSAVPDFVKPHEFSRGFEKRMNRVIKADKKYGGRVWMERCVRAGYSVAAVILCLFMINFVSIKAFDVSIWNVVTEKLGNDYTRLSLNKEKNTADTTVSNKNQTGENLIIKEVPQNYALVTNSIEGDDVVQILQKTEKKSVVGEISYMQTPVEDGMTVDVSSLEESSRAVAKKLVHYYEEKGRIVAYFTDNKFMHIITIEGPDSTKDMVDIIIKQLKEQ